MMIGLCIEGYLMLRGEHKEAVDAWATSDGRRVRALVLTDEGGLNGHLLSISTDDSTQVWNFNTSWYDPFPVAALRTLPTSMWMIEDLEQWMKDVELPGIEVRLSGRIPS